MQNESRIYWQTLTPRNPTEFVIQIFRTYVERQDGYIGANFLERKENHGFEFKLGSNREINYQVGELKQTTITYELSYS